jgi:carboxyl-terminal processing protease
LKSSCPTKIIATTHLKTESTKEKQFTEIQAEYNTLQAKLLATKKNDLQLHKDEIKQVLENEIASRYYFNKGRYETNFKYDTELAKAVETMQGKTRYDAILKGEGNYKIIGKPIAAAPPVKKDDDSDSQ